MLRATAQIGCSTYIQRVNNLILEAHAKLQLLPRHKEDIKTTEFNNFKTYLTNIIHRKVETFADLHAQIIEGITRDQDLDTIEIRPRSRINNMAELSDLKHMICQIEALIKKAETLQDTS